MAVATPESITTIRKTWKASVAAEAKAVEAREAYELALVSAKDAGHSYGELAEASGLSAPRIQQIVRARRKDESK